MQKLRLGLYSPNSGVCLRIKESLIFVQDPETVFTNNQEIRGGGVVISLQCEEGAETGIKQVITGPEL
jgi:hypothetical protein